MRYSSIKKAFYSVEHVIYQHFVLTVNVHDALFAEKMNNLHFAKYNNPSKERIVV